MNSGERFNQPVKRDYYKDKPGKAILDFCIGFFGVWIIGIVLPWLVFLFASLLSSPEYLPVGFFIPALIVFLASLFGIVYFFRIGRRYIAIGIISSALLPLLIFGACLVIIASALP